MLYKLLFSSVQFIHYLLERSMMWLIVTPVQSLSLQIYGSYFFKEAVVDC